MSATVSLWTDRLPPAVVHCLEAHGAYAGTTVRLRKSRPLRAAATRRYYQQLRRAGYAPGAAARRIAARTGRHPSTIYRHLDGAERSDK